MVRVRFRVRVRVRDGFMVRVMVRVLEKLLDYNSVLWRTGSLPDPTGYFLYIKHQ